MAPGLVNRALCKFGKSIMSNKQLELKNNSDIVNDNVSDNVSDSV